MNTGRLPQPRIDVPADVEIFQYSCQKLNIWEFQKEQLRQHIAEDKSKFFTYAKDFLSLAFPRVNEHEAALQEKQKSIAAWKSKNGFDNLDKKQNFNEHPKKPPQSKVDELLIPYHVQMNESLSKLSKKVYRPEDEGKPDFVKLIPGVHTFS